MPFKASVNKTLIQRISCRKKNRLELKCQSVSGLSVNLYLGSEWARQSLWWGKQSSACSTPVLWVSYGRDLLLQLSRPLFQLLALRFALRQFVLQLLYLSGEGAVTATTTNHQVACTPCAQPNITHDHVMSSATKPISIHRTGHAVMI